MLWSLEIAMNVSLAHDDGLNANVCQTITSKSTIMYAEELYPQRMPQCSREIIMA